MDPAGIVPVVLATITGLSRVSAQMARVGQLAGLIVAVTIFFMVVKP